MQSVAYEYFAHHPELLDRPALELVSTALAEAFPCSRSESKNEKRGYLGLSTTELAPEYVLRQKAEWSYIERKPFGPIGCLLELVK